MKRPVIQDLVQSAMQKSASAQKIANEAARQMKTASAPESQETESISTDFATKLASAIEYMIPQLTEKEAAPEQSRHHNADPAILPSGVTATTLENGNPVAPNNTGHGLSQHMPPLRPAVERGPNGGAPNQLKTNDHEWPGGKGTVQHTSLQSAPKTAAEALLEKNLAKVATAVTQSVPADGDGERTQTMLGRTIESKRVEKTASELLLEKNLAKVAERFPENLKKDKDDDAKTRAEKDKERETPPRVPREPKEKDASAVSNFVGTVGNKAMGTGYKALDAIGKRVTSEGGKNMLASGYRALDKGVGHAGKVGAGVLGVGALGAAGAAGAASGHKNKQASIEAGAERLLAIVKEAEDAIYPARISAGKYVPLETDDDGHNFAKRPKGPYEKFRTTEGVVKATPRDTVVDKIKDTQPYFKEPMFSAKHDNTLNKAFKYTAAAGAKYASANDVQQVSESRLLLAKLAQQVSQEGQK